MLAAPVSARPAVTPDNRLRVICVDDEPNVLEGLALHLRRRYDVSLATSGAAALEALERDKRIAVVISDMRMPGMDGAAFLSRARQLVPDAMRILLTGQADLDSAIAAVNEGQLFRFLTKPCPPSALLMAVDAAAVQYRLVMSEHVLLEQTLHGSITALTEVLALTSPLSFGRAMRIREIVSDLAERLGMPERWQVEVAAMVSQLGCITLPAETVENLYYGRFLTIDEQRMVRHLPAVSAQLLGSIPRLEVVRGMVMACAHPIPVASGTPAEPQQELIALGAQMLRIAIDFDTLELQGHSPAAALKMMRGQSSRYDVAVFEALKAVSGAVREAEDARDVGLGDLQVGMVLIEDVKLTSGALLAPRGYKVTRGFVARAENFRHSIPKKTVRVTGPPARLAT